MTSLYIPDFSEMLAVARSRGADSEAPGLWDGLVGAWPLAEGGGLTAHDLSGYGNEGTLTNMDAGTDHVVTEKGPALDFDGSDDYVAVPSLPAATRWTVSAWANKGTPEAWAGVAAFRLGAVNGNGIAVDNDKDDWQIIQGNAGKKAIPISSGFVHVVAVWDGATGYIYENAISGSGVDGLAGNHGMSDSRIGDAFGNFGGMIGPVSAYNRTLALDEIQQLYAEPYAKYTLRRRVYKAAVAPSGNPYSAYAQQVA